MENYELVDQMGKSTPDSLNRLGLVYMTEGLSDLAVDAFTRALQANPDAPLAPAIQASRLLAFNGELDAAKQELQALDAELQVRAACTTFLPRDGSSRTSR